MTPARNSPKQPADGVYGTYEIGVPQFIVNTLGLARHSDGEDGRGESTGQSTTSTSKLSEAKYEACRKFNTNWLTQAKRYRRIIRVLETAPTRQV